VEANLVFRNYSYAWIIGWLAIKNRLATKDRLLRWGLGVDSVCQFRRHALEDRDHLFSKCSFTKRIWKTNMALCLVPNIPFNWSLLLSWGMHNLKGKSFRASLCKVAWWATIYHIWIQIHGGVINSEDQIIKDIHRDVKGKLDSIAVNNSILDRIFCTN
jgi:hypothetical protein